MSTFTDARDTLVHFVSTLFTSVRAAINTMLHASLSDLEKIGEENLKKADQIVKDAVNAAENAGGSWNAKRDAALAVIVPQFLALGISLLSTSIDVLISDAVAALGFSGKAQVSA